MTGKDNGEQGFLTKVQQNIIDFVYSINRVGKYQRKARQASEKKRAC